MTVVDEYIAAIPEPEIRNRLEALRAVIQEEVPDGEDVISYGLATIDLHGKHLVHFGAFQHHIGFYPTGKGMAAIQEELAGFVHSKGTIHFPHDRPLPLELVRKVVRIRLQQVAAGSNARRARR